MSGTFLPFIPSDANYEFTIPIDDAPYRFVVRWNSRDDLYHTPGWYFDMYDSDGRVMVAGVKIVLGAHLGRRSAHEFFDKNVIVAIDTTLDDRDPTFDDLGVRVFVKHMTLGEYIADLMAVGRAL